MEIACKVSWVFDLVWKPYRLEVSVYHEWDTAFLQTSSQQWRVLNTADVPGPTKSCGIMMYNQGWDEMLQEANNLGTGQADFAKGFPWLFEEGQTTTNVENFVEEVQELQKFMELATIPDKH